MARLNIRTATVESIDQERGDVQFVSVNLRGHSAKAVNFLEFGGALQPGSQVLVNTTAVDMKLGSGGYHFVLPHTARRRQGWGHLMKLRYTPLQIQVDCAEEQQSPWHKMFQSRGGVERIPVLAAELHSMVPPLALAIKALHSQAVIAYVYTDGGALPAAFSGNIDRLGEMGVISQVITSGHSFGGDLETVNIFTGLQAAAKITRAHYIIAAMGPGIAGTGTVYGFSGIEQAFVLQAARVLGAQPILVPRIGFCDERPRHQGLSHHTQTILHAYGGPVHLPLPLLPRRQRAMLLDQVGPLKKKCHLRWLDGRFIAAIAQKQPKLFSSMGRGYAENRAFFQALAAAARFAVGVDRSKPRF